MGSNSSRCAKWPYCGHISIECKNCRECVDIRPGIPCPECGDVLGTIRAELKRDHYLSDANAETLLRLIDALRKDNRELRSMMSVLLEASYRHYVTPSL